MGIKSGESGIALFIVLWVLTLLSVIAGEFCHAMRMEANITQNFKEETQAYYIAEAGLNMAVAEIMKKRFMSHGKNPPAGDEEEETGWRVNVNNPEIPFAQGRYKVRIGNEAGKVNINGADEHLLKMILNNLDLEDSDMDVIADSILDWRDRDDFHRVNGAEDNYYLSLPEPYECKDSDFDSIEELLFIRGITSELFYGGLKDMVTIYGDGKSSGGGNPNLFIRPGMRKSSAGLNRININAACPRMLRSLPQMTDGLVLDIMEYRENKDFSLLSDLLPVVGADIYSAITPYITLKMSPCYTIESVGTVEEGPIQQKIQALVEMDAGMKKGYRVIQWIDGNSID